MVALKLPRKLRSSLGVRRQKQRFYRSLHLQPVKFLGMRQLVPVLRQARKAGFFPLQSVALVLEAKIG